MNKLYDNTTFTWAEIVAVLNVSIRWLKSPECKISEAENLARRLEIRQIEKNLLFRFATGTQVAA